MYHYCNNSDGNATIEHNTISSHETEEEAQTAYTIEMRQFFSWASQANAPARVILDDGIEEGWGDIEEQTPLDPPHRIECEMVNLALEDVRHLIPKITNNSSSDEIAHALNQYEVLVDFNIWQDIIYGLELKEQYDDEGNLYEPDGEFVLTDGRRFIWVEHLDEWMEDDE